jgi:hypothetical protein
MVRQRQSHDRGADAARCERQHQLCGGQSGRRAGAERGHCRIRRATPVSFGRDASGCHPERARGDEERSIGAGKRFAKCLDGTAIRVGCALEVTRESQVVLEGEMNHAVGCGRAAAQAVEIVEGAALHLCAGGGEGGGGGVGASEPDDLMARADELGNDGGADPAGRAGHENTHEKTSG